MSIEVEVASDLRGPSGQSLGVMNTTLIDTAEISRDPQVQALTRQLSSWVETARSNTQRGGMFDRTKFTPPDTPYENMRTAFAAMAEDDIVAAVADATEAMAFEGGMKWEGEKADDADFFNQLSADLNLDDKIRQMWREEFATDQFVVAKIWGYKEYKVRGKSESGNKRKKAYKVWCPVRLVILNSLQVAPIGHGPLRSDDLAWQAGEYEIGQYQLARTDEVIDPLMTSFFSGTYLPGRDEQLQLVEWGVRPDSLLAMNPAWVFRHCHNRPDYKKFGDVRMRAVFPLLDLKRQLMASDRAMLVGSANYILLIRKGSDTKAATADEIENLKKSYNFLAKLPVIISDHRLEIDIIAPKLDFVLDEARYATLDKRILARTLSSFAAGEAADGGSATTFEAVLAKVIANRRHMIRRTLEREIARAVVDHPRNAGLFDSKPSLVFTPRNVSVGTNQGYLAQLLTLRTQREISRETILEAMGLDEATEAQRLELEELIYDDIFKTQVPFSATGPNAPAQTPNGTPEAPATSGRRGGRPVGGGSSATSPDKTAKPKTANGNPSTPKKES